VSNIPPPLSIADTATALHEAYLSLLAAGFTKAQALYLVGQLLRPTAPDQAP